MGKEEEVVSMIKSCIAVRKDGLPLCELENDYRDLVGDRIPYRNLGYDSLKDFLSTVPEIRMLGNERNIILSISNEKTAHITAMIECQKSDTRRPRKRRSGFRPPPRTSRRGFRATDRSGRFQSNSYVVPPRFRRSQIERPVRSNLDSKPARAAVESRPLKSHFESSPPNSNFESRPPNSRFESRPSNLHLESRPPNSHLESKPRNSYLKSRPPNSHVESKLSRPNSESKPLRSNLENRLLRKYSESWEKEESRTNKNLGEFVRCDSTSSESGSVASNRPTSSISFSYKNRDENSQVENIRKPTYSTDNDNVGYREINRKNNSVLPSTVRTENVRSEQPFKEQFKNISNGAIKKTRTAASQFYEKKSADKVEINSESDYEYSVDQKQLLGRNVVNDLVPVFKALDFENTTDKKFHNVTLNSRFTAYQNLGTGRHNSSEHLERENNSFVNRKPEIYSDWDENFRRETASYRNIYPSDERIDQNTRSRRSKVDGSERKMNTLLSFDEYKQKPNDSFPKSSASQSRKLVEHSAISKSIANEDFREEYGQIFSNTSHPSESEDRSKRNPTRLSLATTNERAPQSSSYKEHESIKARRRQSFIEPARHSNEESWFKKPAKSSVSSRLDRWREPSEQSTESSFPLSTRDDIELTNSKQLDYGNSKQSKFKEPVKNRKLSLSSPVYEEYIPEYPRLSVNSRLIACRQINQEQLESVERRISAPKKVEASQSRNSKCDSDSDLSWDELEVEPTVFGYQMIGDDIFIDLAEQNLGGLVHLKTNKSYGLRKICGLSISGQTLEECAKRIPTSKLSDRVILLLGTVDIIKGAKVDHLKKCMATLVSVFMKHVDKLVLLTLPPLIGDFNWKTLLAFNKWIKSLKNMSSRVIVIDIWPLFFPRDSVDYKPETVDYKLYERRTRPIAIGPKIYKFVYWNSDGRQLVISSLREYLHVNQLE